MNKSGHMTIKLSKCEQCNKAELICYAKNEKIKGTSSIIKIHKATGHKNELNLRHAFEQAGKLNEEVKNYIKDNNGKLQNM